MNILLVEDQATTRSIVASRLRNWGHSVVDVENGKTALDHVLRHKKNLDILITDWDMPLMDGVTLARRVRELTDSSNYIYIILFTVKDDDTDLVRGFREGRVDDYIIKPFSAVQLRLHVEVAGRLIGMAHRLRQHGNNMESLVRKQTEAVRQTQEEIIVRLFNALESRDQETAQHVRRIGIMSVCMARRLGWDEEQLDMLRAAAPLHDIGKIGIRDALLRKPGKLTDEEFRQIKEHTVIGARILSGSDNPAIQMAERIAGSHHECWDGSGYPKGLQGTAIPLEAHLVSVVDVYDAKLSDRVYRKGQPEEEVLDFIKAQSGSKFSPALVKIFMAGLEEMKELCWAEMVK